MASRCSADTGMSADSQIRCLFLGRSSSLAHAASQAPSAKRSAYSRGGMYSGPTSVKGALWMSKRCRKRKSGSSSRFSTRASSMCPMASSTLWCGT